MAYFDHAATTPLDPRVRDVMLEHAGEPLNPSSIHQPGQRARRLLDQARGQLAAAVGLGDAGQVCFTSGATEAANLALRGLATGNTGGPLHVVTSALEHSCVRETLEHLAETGRVVLHLLPVGGDGRAVLDDDAIPMQAGLLCLMHANNETGVVQDVAAARALARRRGIPWLCDACQTLGKEPLVLDDLGADLVILSAHKAYGPVGIGCLAGPGLGRLVPQITGGAQEEERRAGTPSVPLARAFAAAAELAVAELGQRREHLAALEEEFLACLARAGAPHRLNGTAPRLPGFLNLSFPGRDAVDMVIALDQHGESASPGSACSTGVVAASPVLAAMYPDDAERAAGGVRFTFGRQTTRQEVATLAETIVSIL
ncbi:MAG: cysteine desulfurase [Candidatus Sumerlaeota bacterium]|nr:cysteine desulfurase [Candidatus Sumerlaeota bacterium]